MLSLAPLTAPLLRPFLFPNRATRRPILDDEVAVRVRGITLRGRCANLDADRAIVYFGGNGEDATGWIRRFVQAAPDHAVYLLNYRGYGASDGRASARAIVADWLALVSLIEARHPGGDITYVGRSLGSGIAMQVAARRPPARLVLVTPFDSLAAVASDVSHVPRLLADLVLPDRLDSLRVVSSVKGPVLVMRAGGDALVRPPRTAALVERLEDHGIDTTEVVFPAADHRSIALDAGYWSALRDFLA